MRHAGLLLAVIAGVCTGQLAAQRPVETGDLNRIREVSDPQLSPDGKWVAYTVSTADTVEDKRDADIWMASWDGGRSVRLTWTRKRRAGAPTAAISPFSRPATTRAKWSSCGCWTAGAARPSG